MLDFLLITLKKAFDTWKTDWTASRAQKIDTIEGRLSSTRMSILDGLNNRLSSIEKALNGKVNQVSIENLTKKVEGVISAIASKASQTSLDKAEKAIKDRVDDVILEIINARNNLSLRRVQRGLVMGREGLEFFELPNGATNSSIKRFYKDITLPYSVRTSRSMVLLEVGNYKDRNSTSYMSFACQLLNDNTLRIITNSVDEVKWDFSILSWQVIEYY